MAEPLAISTALTADELRRRARSEEDGRASRRMLAIASALDGLERLDAAKSGAMSDQALRDAIRRYNTLGLDGLYDKPRSGRPCKIGAEKRKELCEIVRAGPDVEAQDLSSYTRDDAAKIAKDKWGVVYHVTSIGRIFRAGGLSRQKTRPSHPKKDAQAVEAFKKGSGDDFRNRQ
jgi:transposase